MSTIIKLKCIDQVLTFESTPVIASGGKGEDFIAFEFCSKWDGLAKTAVFWRTEDKAYHIVLDEADSGPIPPEVLEQDGLFYFGVFGVDTEGNLRTSEVLRYNVVKGVITEGTKPSDPTSDIYTQLLADYAEVLGALNQFNDAVAGAAADASAAAASATAAEEFAFQAIAKANEAAQSASNANTSAGLAYTNAERAAKSASDAEAAASSAAPAVHASNHAAGGSDPITPGDIGAVPTTRKVNDKPLSGDISLTASDVGAVPTTRKVNDKPLSGDISLTASDVGAVIYYNELAQIGIEKGSETVATIAAKMANRSELWEQVNTVDGNTHNPKAYPAPYGLLIIRKRTSQRVEVEFYGSTTILASSYWRGFVNGTNFYGWYEHKSDFAKISTGTYEGTGDWGVNNPNELPIATIGFTPKILMVHQLGGRGVVCDDSGWYDSFIWVMDTERTHAGDGSNIYLQFSLTDTALSWWSENDSDMSMEQCNEDGKTYRWIAIG